MKTLALLICLLTMVPSIWAQQPAKNDSEQADKLQPDTLKARRDSGRVSAKPATVSGYRVQVYSGNNRAQAIQIRTEVLEKYTDYAAYLIYKQPTFRVRVGDFRSRAAAQELLRELKPLYPVSFIVPDEVLENPVLAPRETEEPVAEDADRTDP
jgi:cell division septation protein DedD